MGTKSCGTRYTPEVFTRAHDPRDSCIVGQKMFVAQLDDMLQSQWTWEACDGV